MRRISINNARVASVCRVQLFKIVVCIKNVSLIFTSFNQKLLRRSCVNTAVVTNRGKTSLCTLLFEVYEKKNIYGIDID